MVDFNVSVAASADDGRAYVDGTNFDNSETSIYIGNFSLGRHAFFRFLNITIPKGADINTAVMRFDASANLNTDVQVDIHFEQADSATQPTDGSDLIGRGLGSAVDWDSQPNFTAGSSYDTPDLTSILQTIVDRAGWSSGNALTIHIVDDSTGAFTRREIASHDHLTYAPAELRITYTPAPPNDDVTISESVTVGLDGLQASAFQSIEIQESVPMHIGFSGDLSEAQNVNVSEYTNIALEFVGELEESENIGLSVFRDVALEGPKISVVESVITISEQVRMEYLIETSDNVEVSESVAVQRGYDAAASDSFVFNDAFEAFNYTQWLKANLSVARLRFYCTITGAADLQSDVEVPIRSFYARKNSGNPSYLQVVISGFDYAGMVANRPNGELIIEIGYEVDGAVSLREQISVVDIDDISSYDGGVNRSITVAGHRTITYSNNLIEINRTLATYHALQKNVLSYRFAFIDPYLNPGDTLIVGETAMTVNNVVYIVDPLRSLMQVSEA